jgi:hypothetical protein
MLSLNIFTVNPGGGGLGKLLMERDTADEDSRSE